MTRTIKGFVFALAFCTLAGKVEAFEEHNVLFDVLVCSQVEQALWMHDAYAKGEGHGLARFAMEEGRSHRYRSDEDALVKNVCVQKETLTGRILSKMVLAKGTIYHVHRVYQFYSLGNPRHIDYGRVFVLDMDAKKPRIDSSITTEKLLQQLLRPVLPHR
jgi:hypothetical protein